MFNIQYSLKTSIFNIPCSIFDILFNSKVPNSFTTLKNTQQQGTRQTIKLSPQQIQFLNLLHLPLVALEQTIKDEVQDNPALEFVEYLDSETAEPQNSENTEGYAEENLQNVNEQSDAPKRYEDTAYEGFNGTKENVFEKPAAHTPTFRENLKEQLSLRQIENPTMAFAEYLIDAIDDDGYLHRSFEDIIDDLSFNLNTFVDEQTIKKALLIVQQLEPIGIGSIDLQEYLMLQLREKARTGVDVSVACAVVGEFMLDLGNHQFEKIQAALNIDNETLKNAIAVIASLNPKPVSGISTIDDRRQIILPDFVVSNYEGHFDITVSGILNNKIKLNANFVETLEAIEKAPKKNSETRTAAQYLKGKIGAAQWLITALEQRNYSLTRTIETVVDLQQSFFKTGDYKKLRPMILKDIAERIGLDISTISRVTSTRYVQTDFGILPLKELFTEGVLMENGVMVSNRVIQEVMLEIIENEDKTNPLNDQQITDLLKNKGYPIARRTAAKYRENLNISNAQMRRILE